MCLNLNYNYTYFSLKYEVFLEDIQRWEKLLLKQAEKKTDWNIKGMFSKNLEILIVTEKLQDSVEIDKEGFGSVTEDRNSSPNSK